jgi:hypothetical protein
MSLLQQASGESVRRRETDERGEIVHTLRKRGFKWRAVVKWFEERGQKFSPAALHKCHGRYLDRLITIDNELLDRCQVLIDRWDSHPAGSIGEETLVVILARRFMRDYGGKS